MRFRNLFLVAGMLLVCATPAIAGDSISIVARGATSPEHPGKAVITYPDGRVVTRELSYSGPKLTPVGETTAKQSRNGVLERSDVEFRCIDAVNRQYNTTLFGWGDSEYNEYSPTHHLFKSWFTAKTLHGKVRMHVWCVVRDGQLSTRFGR
jgi:hypothetical protein